MRYQNAVKYQSMVGRHRKLGRVTSVGNGYQIGGIGDD
jgi:hypothetical protein